MIVRRIHRATGKEVAPVSLMQAAWAISRAMNERPTAGDVDDIFSDLQAGTRQITRTYEYVPDADGGTATIELRGAQ